MKNLLQITKIIFYFFFLSIFVVYAQPALAKKLVDRLVVEIESVAYSEREVVSYSLMKQILLGKAEKNNYVISQKSWQHLLDSFTQDKILLTYIDSLSSARDSWIPDKPMLDRATRQLEGSLKMGSTWTQKFKKLRLSEKEQNQALVDILRLQKFYTDMRTNLDLPLYEEKGYWGWQVRRKSKWYKSVEASLAWRYFKGADKGESF